MFTDLARKIGVFFTDLTLKIRVFLQIQREKLAFFGVNFIFQKFCLCKKMTNIRYGVIMNVFMPPMLAVT